MRSELAFLISIGSDITVDEVKAVPVGRVREGGSYSFGSLVACCRVQDDLAFAGIRLLRFGLQEFV